MIRYILFLSYRPKYFTGMLVMAGAGFRIPPGRESKSRFLYVCIYGFTEMNRDSNSVCTYCRQINESELEG
jgi:hypothetical protein